MPSGMVGLPAAEDRQTFTGGGAREIREEYRHHQIRLVRDGEGLVVQLEQADLGMSHPLGPAGAVVDVVSSPQRTKLVTGDRELADQLGEVRIVRAAGGVGVQPGDDLGCHVAPVGVERRRVRMQEHEACRVAKRRLQGAEAEDGVPEDTSVPRPRMKAGESTWASRIRRRASRTG
jgi:hypothetical protein